MHKTPYFWNIAAWSLIWVRWPEFFCQPQNKPLAVFFVLLPLPFSPCRFPGFWWGYCAKSIDSGVFQARGGRGWTFWNRHRYRGGSLANVCDGYLHVSTRDSGLRRFFWIQNFKVADLSNEKNLGWLGYIGDYTTQLYRDYNKPL